MLLQQSGEFNYEDFWMVQAVPLAATILHSSLRMLPIDEFFSVVDDSFATSDLVLKLLLFLAEARNSRLVNFTNTIASSLFVVIAERIVSIELVLQPAPLSSQHRSFGRNGDG